MIQIPLRTPLKLHAPAFLACAAVSLLSRLPPGRLLFPLCWAPLLSFPTLVLFGFVCLLCGPLFWLVLVAPPSVLFWFVLLAWPVVCFVWFVLFSLCCSSLVGFSVLFLAFVGFSSCLTGQVRSIFCFHLHN